MMHRSRFFKNRYKDFEGTVGSCEYVRELIPQLLQHISKDCPPRSSSNRDGGLYVGPAGIGYAFYHVAESGLFQEHRETYLKKALEYLQVSLNDASRINPRSKGGIGASFLLGHAGVYAVSALTFNALGLLKERDDCIQKFLQLHEICKPINFFPSGSDELFVGRAGYLCASLKLNQMLGTNVIPSEVTLPLCDVTVQSGKQYSHHRRSASPLMYSYYDTEYLGAGHGISCILQILLCYPEYFKGKNDIEPTIAQAVDFVLHCEQQNGNYPPVAGESQLLVHWCHGAPGVVYLLAKAYLTWKDEKYLHATIRCGEVIWQHGLLRKGPGICHGVAGSGYVFLLLYRLTRDEKYLYRAYKFADFMQTDEFLHDARTPDCPYSLYEGLSGTVCYYTDLLQPEKAAFPFFDVFS